MGCPRREFDKGKLSLGNFPFVRLAITIKLSGFAFKIFERI